MAISWDFLWPKPGTFSWPFTLAVSGAGRFREQCRADHRDLVDPAEKPDVGEQHRCLRAE